MANILVLDDVADAARLIRRVLEGAGHTVSSFTEEEEALEHAKHHPVDLAILDIKLRQMSGVDVLEELKKRVPGVKAIMLTGYPTLETAQEAKRLGAADYCIKPMDNEELEEKVASVLRQQPESAS
jgi:DNA-binding NtrC family response regulator